MSVKDSAPRSGSRSRNEVVLRGRVSAPAQERELASGDTIVTARVIVDRDGDTAGRQRVDSIDCVAWSPRAQRSLRNWEAGQQVHVEGAIRRRFFRGEAGPVSRVEVEVKATRRLQA
jgi:single-strand DNA-binding protein